MEGKTKEKKGIDYYMQLPYSILLHEIEEEGKKYWIAEIPELPGCRSHGSTVEEAVKSVNEAKQDWILDSLEEAEEVPEPVERDKFSGKTLLRMSRSLHRALSLMAESEKLSLNQLIATILAKEVGKFNVLNRVEQKLDNLLEKVNDVIEDRRAASLKTRILAQHYQTEYVVVGTSPDIETQVAVGAMPLFPSVASTSPPLEELQSRLQFQPSRLGRVVFNASSTKEAKDKVVVKQ